MIEPQKEERLPLLAYAPEHRQTEILNTEPEQKQTEAAAIARQKSSPLVEEQQNEACDPQSDMRNRMHALRAALTEKLEQEEALAPEKQAHDMIMPRPRPRLWCRLLGLEPKEPSTGDAPSTEVPEFYGESRFAAAIREANERWEMEQARKQSSTNSH